jgi:hypothetical protein
MFALLTGIATTHGIAPRKWSTGIGQRPTNHHQHTSLLGSNTQRAFWVPAMAQTQNKGLNYETAN